MNSGRIIFYLIIFGLLINAVFLFFTQINAVSEAELETTHVGGWYYQVEFIANVILTFVSIYAFAKYRKSFPATLNICYIILLLLISTVSVRDISQFAKAPTLFYSPKGLGTWINFGLLYFMAEEFFASKLFRLFYFFCFLFFIFNLVRIAGLGTISNRQQAENAIRDTTVFLLWVYPFYFFDDSDKAFWAKIMKYGLIMLLAFFAFAISSRSYILMILCYILIKVKRDLKDKRNSFLIVGIIGALLLGGYYLVANIQNFTSIQGLLSIFTGRMNDDTRTSQLKEFLAQYDTDKLFTGVGIMGTWNWSSNKIIRYEWLDNQLILICWWFGIQTLIAYVFYLLYALFKKIKVNNFAISNAKIIIFFWLMACAGFAIYATVSSKLFFYFITFLVGFVTVNRRTAIVTIAKRQRPGVEETV